MNVWLKVSSFIFLFLALISISTAASQFNACGVNFEDESWFEVEDSSGRSVLIVDPQGDIFLLGEQLENTNIPGESIVLENMIFNNQYRYYTSFLQNGTLSSNTGIIFENSANQSVARFSGTSIETQGFGVYEGSQAACQSDGYYCNGMVLEELDFFCNVFGDRNAACRNITLSSLNCATVPSIDTDGGVYPMTGGIVTDTDSCDTFPGDDSCGTTEYADVCTSGTQLTEFFTTGTDVQFSSISCSSFDYTYCLGTDVYDHVYQCIDPAGNPSECSGTSTFIQSCNAPPPQYSSWTCNSPSEAQRTVTSYTATCSGAGVCGQTSSSSTQTQTCSGDQVCSAGSGCIDNSGPSSCSLSASPSSGIDSVSSTLTGSFNDPDSGDDWSCTISYGGNTYNFNNCGPSTDSIRTDTFTTDTTITFTATDSTGASCSDTTSVTVSPNLPPSVDSFSVNPSSGTDPLDVTFSGSVSDPEGDSMSCTLDFGDGNSQSVSCGGGSFSSVGHTYSSSSTATLTVSAIGGSDSASTTISVGSNSPPSVDSFSVNPSSGTDPLDVTFSGSVSDPEGDSMSCTLDFGDGNSQSVSCGGGSFSGINHIYNSDSTATLTVSATGGSDSESRSIDILSDLSVSLTASPSSDSGTFTTTLTGTISPSGSYTCNLLYGDGDSTGSFSCSNSISRSHTYSDSATARLDVTYMGSTFSDTVSLSITGTPQTCGNGIPEGPEECDNGDFVDGDFSTNSNSNYGEGGTWDRTCTADCKTPAVCPLTLGDGTSLILDHSTGDNFWPEALQPGNVCDDENIYIACNNGVLRATTGNMADAHQETCPNNSCTLDGQTVSHGNTGTFYTESSTFDTCDSQDRTCNNGNFEGDSSYQYSTCEELGVWSESTLLSTGTCQTSVTTFGAKETPVYDRTNSCSPIGTTNSYATQTSCTISYESCYGFPENTCNLNDECFWEPDVWDESIMEYGVCVGVYDVQTGSKQLHYEQQCVVDDCDSSTYQACSSGNVVTYNSCGQQVATLSCSNGCTDGTCNQISPTGPIPQCGGCTYETLPGQWICYQCP